MIKEQVFVNIPCMNVCKQLYVDIDIAKSMKRVYTISERLNSCYCYYCGLHASFLSFRTHKKQQRNQVGLTPAVKMSR